MNHTESQLENLSLEELRELALSTGATEVQPRDEFTKPEESEPVVGEAEQPQTPEQPADEPEPDEPQVFVHVEEYDPGVGGKQKFTGTGASPAEAVADCLAQIKNAHIHATRKINEQQQRLKEREKLLTKDEEFVVSQQMQTDPAAAIDIIIQKRLEKELAPVRAEQAAKELQANNDRAAQEWLAANPAAKLFFPNPKNASLVAKYLQLNHGGVWTRENLTEAFNEVKDLLTQAQEKTPVAPAAPRVVRRSSGLPVSRSAPAPVKKEYTQADLENMSDEEFRKLGANVPGAYKGGW